jgi:hypothetical protein
VELPVPPLETETGVVAVSVANDPAAGVVPPIAGGVAKFWVAKVPNAVPLSWQVPVQLNVPENVLMPLTVWVAARVSTVSLVPGNAKDVPSVPVNVRVLEAVNVFPAPSVNVPVPVVMAFPLIVGVARLLPLIVIAELARRVPAVPFQTAIAPLVDVAGPETLPPVQLVNVPVVLVKHAVEFARVGRVTVLNP